MFRKFRTILKKQEIVFEETSQWISLGWVRSLDLLTMGRRPPPQKLTPARHTPRGPLPGDKTYPLINPAQNIHPPDDVDPWLTLSIWLMICSLAEGWSAFVDHFDVWMYHSWCFIKKNQQLMLSKSSYFFIKTNGVRILTMWKCWFFCKTYNKQNNFSNNCCLNKTFVVFDIKSYPPFIFKIKKDKLMLFCFTFIV